MKCTSAAVFAALVSTTLADVVRRQTASPIPPKQDPWYTAPADLADYEPGHVFKVRSAPGLVTAIANVSDAYQLLYRTTNSQYNASFAVTTLLLPPGWNDSCRNQLLSYGIPYDSADLDASPSYALYTGGGVFGTGEISTALGRGWAVSVADYEGPLASFTAGVTSGLATLDSIRAIFNYEPFEIYNDYTTYAYWGYSGGALAGEWATELQTTYAPDLYFSGAALGGLTPNVTSVLFSINGTVYAGLAPAGILGLASQYADAKAYLESHLVQTGDTYNAANFNAAVNYTLAEEIGAYAGQNIGAYFTNGLDALKSSVAQNVIHRDGIMGLHGIPTIPLFVYKAIGDDISVIADTDALIDKYCAAGATIDYQRNTVGDHASELINGRARALAYLDGVFAGTMQPAGCVIQNVTVSA